MSLVDKPFKEAIRDLPTKKLSWWADRRIKKMLRHRAAELEGRSLWFWGYARQLVAVPVAFAVFVTSLGSYAFYSPTVVRGDMLYAMKTTIEDYRYPREGTSEDRIAYHLWLSERRYDEVNEILERLGKKPLVLIPAAQASNGVDESLNELDQILLETLQSATQHVDYAFLISDEIREVERVRAVKTHIQQTLEKQKTFLEKATPVLKEVKLRERKKARIKREKPVQQQEVEVPSESNSETAVPVEEVLPSVSETQEVPMVEPAVDPIEETVASVSETALEPATASEESIPEPVEEPVELEEEELEDIGSFLEDRFIFQQQLLTRIDDAIGEANVSGVQVVRLTVHVKPLQEAIEVSDGLFREALVVHYERSQALLQSELNELDQELMVQEVPEQTVQEIVEVPESAEEVQMPGEIVEQSPEAVSPVALESEQESINTVAKSEPVVTELPPVASTETVVPVLSESVAPDTMPDKQDDQDDVDDSEGEKEKVNEKDEARENELPIALPQEEVLAPLLAPTEPMTVPEISLSSEKSESSLPQEVELEQPKTECELKAEERCALSEQKNCTEKEIRECEERLKKEREKKEKERDIFERAERTRKELQEIQQKMEELRLNLRNSAPIEMEQVTEQLKAGILQERKKQDEQWQQIYSSERKGR